MRRVKQGTGYGSIFITTFDACASSGTQSSRRNYPSIKIHQKFKSTTRATSRAAIRIGV